MINKLVCGGTRFYINLVVAMGSKGLQIKRSIMLARVGKISIPSSMVKFRSSLAVQSSYETSEINGDLDLC